MMKKSARMTEFSWLNKLSAGLVLSGVLLFQSGCAVRGTADTLVWPALPAEPRVIYEATLRSPQNLVEADGGNRLRKALSGEADVVAAPAMSKPYDIAASAGLVVVSDTQASVVHLFDTIRKRAFPFGWRGKGRLMRPLGVAIDGQRNIYVADGVGQIQVFNMLGHYKRTIGDAADFDRLTDVAVSPSGDRIYALDRGQVDSANHRVTVYSAQGEKLFRFGGRGADAGKFNHPIQITIGPKDQVYVLDAGNFRVQVFNRLGEYQYHWGQPGRYLGNLARPRGLAVDSGGRVYVTDGAYQNFQIFNPQGQLLLPVGEGGNPDSPGRYAMPSGIALDQNDRIYVVDQLFRKVEVLRLLDEGERKALLESQ